MNRNRQISRAFSFMWDGVIHLEDGSRWQLADPSRRHDVTWWHCGEPVEIERKRGGRLLRNLLRGETVPIADASEGWLEMAA
jgi:hypothetical protein